MEERVGVWNHLTGRLSQLPERFRDDVVMQECIGMQYRGRNATTPHYVEVGISMPGDEAEVQQAIEDVILIANTLLPVTDVEAYHPAAGYFKFRPMGHKVGFTTL